MFSNLRDRVENRIETSTPMPRSAPTAKSRVAGSARAGEQPLKFDIKATAPPPPLERQNVPAEFAIDAPGLLQAALSGRAEMRLNGSVVMINGLSGTLGDGAFNGWASVDIASKPLVKLDLDFQRLTSRPPRARRARRRRRGAMPRSISTGSIMSTRRRKSPQPRSIGDGRFAPAAIEATLADGVLRAVANLGAYGGQANGDLSIDASTATRLTRCSADLVGVRALPLLKSLADFDKLDGRMQAKISVRARQQPARDHDQHDRHRVHAVPGRPIRGLNVAQMIRSLTASTLSGWQESEEQATDLSQLSASFKIDKGQAATTDLNLIGPLVKMTGAGTVDLGTKQIGVPRRAEARDDHRRPGPQPGIRSASASP